jgi:hypothetical protein
MVESTAMQPAQYHHTQRGPLYLTLYLVALVLLFLGRYAVPDQAGRVAMAVGALVCVVFSLAFRTLTVTDRGDELELRFGPLPFFGKRIPYARLRAVRRARSKLIDGWGIHFVPGRGWTYNLWGYDCAELELEGGRRVRVGSDDADNLVAFLQTKVASR